MTIILGLHSLKVVFFTQQQNRPINKRGPQICKPSHSVKLGDFIRHKFAFQQFNDAFFNDTKTLSTLSTLASLTIFIYFLIF